MRKIGPWKEAPVCPVLKSMFQQSINIGELPHNWLCANLWPIPYQDNYAPSTITPWKYPQDIGLGLDVEM